MRLVIFLVMSVCSSWVMGGPTPPDYYRYEAGKAWTSYSAVKRLEASLIERFTVAGGKPVEHFYLADDVLVIWDSKAGHVYLGQFWPPDMTFGWGIVMFAGNLRVYQDGQYVPFKGDLDALKTAMARLLVDPVNEIKREKDTKPKNRHGWINDDCPGNTYWLNDFLYRTHKIKRRRLRGQERNFNLLDRAVIASSMLTNRLRLSTSSGAFMLEVASVAILSEDSGELAGNDILPLMQQTYKEQHGYSSYDHKSLEGLSYLLYTQGARNEQCRVQAEEIIASIPPEYADLVSAYGGLIRLYPYVLYVVASDVCAEKFPAQSAAFKASMSKWLENGSERAGIAFENLTNAIVAKNNPKKVDELIERLTGSGLYELSGRDELFAIYDDVDFDKVCRTVKSYDGNPEKAKARENSWIKPQDVNYEEIQALMERLGQ